MNTKLVLLAAALLAPLATFAAPIPGAVANVTLKFNSYDSEPVVASLPDGDTKLVKSSYGNKDLLQELLKEHVLGVNETSVNNWKLVIVDRSPLLGDDGNTLVFYAVKGTTRVQIPSARLGMDVETDVGAEAKTQKVNSSQVLISRKHTFKSLVGISGHAKFLSQTDGYDYTFELTAFASGANSFAKKTLKDGVTLVSFDYNLLGPITFSPIIGKVVDNSQRPVEGSMTFSAFVATDISGYPYTPDP